MFRVCSVIDKILQKKHCSVYSPTSFNRHRRRIYEAEDSMQDRRDCVDSVPAGFSAGKENDGGSESDHSVEFIQ